MNYIGSHFNPLKVISIWSWVVSQPQFGSIIGISKEDSKVSSAVVTLLDLFAGKSPPRLTKGNDDDVNTDVDE